jgi:hypothetical protein
VVRHARIMAVTLRTMTLRDQQPEPLELLDATIARAQEVVDPDLLALVADRIAVTLTDSRPSCVATTAKEQAVCAVVDQMLLDVAGLSDETVRHAASLFGDGELADLVMASYAIEARTRLTLAADRLLGGMA